MPVKVEGIEPIIRKLEKVGGPNALHRPMVRATAHLLDTTAKYPPATSANTPPGNNGYSWYERGFGTRTVTGEAYPTSETLGRRWTSEVTNGGRRGVVGNNASYAPDVQSSEHQKAFHARNGWKTDATVAEQEAGKVADIFNGEIADLLK